MWEASHSLSLGYIWDEMSPPSSGQMAKWPFKLTLFHLNSFFFFFLVLSSRFRGNLNAVMYATVRTPRSSSPALRAGPEAVPSDLLLPPSTFPPTPVRKPPSWTLGSPLFYLWFYLSHLNFTYYSLFETLHTCTIQYFFIQYLSHEKYILP